MGVVPKDRSRPTAAAAEGRGGGSSRVGAAVPDVHLCSSTRTAQTEGGEARKTGPRECYGRIDGAISVGGSPDSQPIPS